MLSPNTEELLVMICLCELWGVLSLVSIGLTVLIGLTVSCVSGTLPTQVNMEHTQSFPFCRHSFALWHGAEHARSVTMPYWRYLACLIRPNSEKDGFLKELSVVWLNLSSFPFSSSPVHHQGTCCFGVHRSNSFSCSVNCFSSLNSCLWTSHGHVHICFLLSQIAGGVLCFSLSDTLAFLQTLNAELSGR